METGFIVLAIAGICQGSFGWGYKRYTPFSFAVLIEAIRIRFTSTHLLSNSLSQ